jgi:L-2,4-diaminobutyrate decarboxylase
MNAALQVISERYANLERPFSGIKVEELTDRMAGLNVCPEAGRDLETSLAEVGRLIAAHSVAVHHPACAAHLHCPPLIASLAAEAVISAMNQSMDSWDQSPAATLLETQMIEWLCDLFQYSGQAEGVFTSGGTQSNLMGLLLARNHFVATRLDWDIQQHGLPPQMKDLRILCSADAHFTVQQSASLLGLGRNAVVPIKTDAAHRMSVDDLDRQLTRLQEQDLLPFALVGTAGTTDFGSIDPLPQLAERAAEQDMWFHVDAAYGGALALSQHHRHRLAGIQQADSISVDFHKLFYQPISCGAFLVKEGARFEAIRLNADYLNPEEDEEEGTPNLVGKSIQTTRRFDALKLFLSLQHLGRARFAQMIEGTLQTATEAARLIAADPQLEAINPSPELNAVVFRYRPQSPHENLSYEAWRDQLNQDIRQILLSEGKAVVARTKVEGASSLKLTLLNPRTTLDDVQAILEEVKQTGKRLEQTKGEGVQHVRYVGTASHYAELS